jgi:hypothetical protein
VSKPYETELRVTEFLPAGSVEALGDGDYRVMFLAHGTTKTGVPRRYYPKRVLEAAAAASIFDGAKMYINHVKPGRDVPHRDLRDWAATIKSGSVRCVEGNLEAVCHAHLPEARAILDDPVAKLNVGLSHDSNIRVSKGRVNGADVHVVEAITHCHSVDFVPDGNAHGRVIEAAQEQEMDMAELTPEQMDEIVKRTAESVVEPFANAVVAKIAESQKAADEAAKAEEAKRQQEAAEAAKPDADKQMEQRVAEAVTAQTADANRRIQEQAEQLKALQDQQAQALTLGAVTTAVTERTDLSPVSQRRVIESFRGQIIAPDQLSTRVQEACDAERNYALELLQANGVRTKVTGSGPTDTTRTQEAAKAYEDGFAQFAKTMGVDAKDLEAMQQFG